jgi:plastocyanin
MKSLSVSLWGALGLLLSFPTFAADLAHPPALSQGTVDWYKNDAYERREVLARCQKGILDKRSRECVNAADAQSSINPPWIQDLPIGIPVFVAVLGYFLAYLANWRLEKRKAELKFVSEQLQYLYGPLIAVTSAASEAVKALNIRHGREQYFFVPGETYTPEDISFYRLWVQEVFMPNNLKIEKIITENAHLIEGEEMPQLFRDVLAHVAGWKAVIKTWEKHPISAGSPVVGLLVRSQDTAAAISYEKALSENTAILPYPRHFAFFVQQIFNDLKRRQQHLIGLIETRTLRTRMQPVEPTGSMPSSANDAWRTREEHMAQTHQIDITRFAYPNTAIAPGDTVRWTNKMRVNLTVTSDSNPPLFDSGNLGPNQSFSHTFGTGGSFPYHCFYHPQMRGTVSAS